MSLERERGEAEAHYFVYQKMCYRDSLTILQKSVGVEACINFTSLPLKHFTSIAYCERDSLINGKSKQQS